MVVDHIYCDPTLILWPSLLSSVHGATLILSFIAITYTLIAIYYIAFCKDSKGHVICYYSSIE